MESRLRLPIAEVRVTGPDQGSGGDRPSAAGAAAVRAVIMRGSASLVAGVLAVGVHAAGFVVVGSWIRSLPPPEPPPVTVSMLDPVELISAPDPALPPAPDVPVAAPPAEPLRPPEAEPELEPPPPPPPPPKKLSRGGRDDAEAARRPGVSRPKPSEGASEGAPKEAPKKDAERQGEAPVPPAVAAAPPTPTPPTPPSPSAASDGDTPGGTTRAREDVEWHRLTRAEGVAEETADPDTTWVADRNQHADEERRALTSTRRAIGEGRSRDTTMAPDQEGEKVGVLRGGGTRSGGVGGPPSSAGVGARATEGTDGAGGAGDQAITGVEPGSTPPPRPGGGADVLADAVARPALPDPAEAAGAPVMGAARAEVLPALVNSGVGGVSLVDPDPPPAPPSPAMSPRVAPRPPPETPSSSRAETNPIPTPAIAPEKGFADDFLAPLIDPGPETARADREVRTAGWASLAILPEDVKLGTTATLSTRDSPLGRWWVAVDDRIRQAWTYPIELAALGVEGSVEVAFVVKKNGEIRELRVLRTSKEPRLDQAALAAIPTRVAPLPDGFRRLPVRITFRYRAP